ncbi:MAG TPA: zf-HC2 domain-containing protein [Longimicrobium sp.]|jgi:anti-sigma factor RsiW
MTPHLSEATLNDYVDGLLPEAERAAAEAHLAACGRCRAEETALRGLVRRLGGLPAEVAPPRDLRPEIAARAAAGEASVRPRLPRWAPLAAAAVLVLGLSLPLYETWRPGQGDASTASADPAVIEFHEAEKRYAGALAELEAELSALRPELPPRAAALLDANLVVVDRALDEYRRALPAYGPDPELARLTLAAYERKLELLRGTLNAAES